MKKYKINNLGIAVLAGLRNTDREFYNRDLDGLVDAINSQLVDAGLVDHVIDMEQAGAARDVVANEPLRDNGAEYWRDYDTARQLGTIRQASTAAFWEMVSEV